MGWTPLDFAAAEPWQFSAALAAWNRSKAPAKPKAPTDAQYREVLRRRMR